jgi:hypothetical protein
MHTCEPNASLEMKCPIPHTGVGFCQPLLRDDVIRSTKTSNIVTKDGLVWAKIANIAGVEGAREYEAGG